MLNYSVKQTADCKIICTVAMEQFILTDRNMHTTHLFRDRLGGL